MSKLIHTHKGFHNLPKFHKKVVVYVEGRDDRVFWSYIFNSIAENQTHIKIAGGVNELHKYLNMVVKDDENVIIASDSHYDVLFNNHVTHQRIVYTDGHSIENTMYCPTNINKLIKKRCRLDYTPHDIAQNWLTDFSTHLDEFLLYDIANEYYKKSLPVMGTTCHQYLVNKRSPYLSKEIIDKSVNNIKAHFSDDEINKVKNIISQSGKPIHKIVCGKFFAGAIINFLKQQVKLHKETDKQISIEHLFDLMVDGCLSCTDACEGFKNSYKSCSIAINSIGN